MFGRRRRAILLETAVELAQDRSEHEVAATTIHALRRMLGPRPDIILTAVDTDEERFEVLGSSTPGAAGSRGAIADHPVLGRLPLDEPAVARADDPRLEPVLAEHLRAGRVRTLLHRPLVAPDGTRIACLTVLRRTRRRDLPQEVDELCRLAASALAAAADRQTIERETDRTTAAGLAVRRLAETLRDLTSARSVDEVVGGLLRGLRALDPELVGAVVGIVSDGVVVQVSAVGTTPRSFVESLKGTRLGGFEIGQRILERHEPIFTGPGDVSLATRTKIMEPLGARSLLAAGGRSGDDVRVVISSYRESPEPPSRWDLWATAALLDHAASVTARLEALDAVGSVADSVDEGVAVLRRGWEVVHANGTATALVPELDEGDTPIYEHDGELVGDDELPVARAWSGERSEAVLRHTTSGRMHHLSAAPLGSGACVLVVREWDEETGTDRPPVTDLGEHRARRAR